MWFTCLTCQGGPFALEEFRIIDVCGHGACKSCMERWIGRKPVATCAQCRQPHNRTNLCHVRLNLELSESPLVHETKKIVDAIGRMDVDTPLESIEKAPHKLSKLTRVAVRQNAGTAIENLFRETISDFEIRIIPVFEELSRLRQENKTLRQQTDTLQKDLARLDRKVEEQRDAIERGKLAAKTAKAYHIQLQERDGIIERLTEENKKLKDDNKEQLGRMDLLKSRELLAVNKYRALKQELKTMEQRRAENRLHELTNDSGFMRTTNALSSAPGSSPPLRKDLDSHPEGSDYRSPKRRKISADVDLDSDDNERSSPTPSPSRHETLGWPSLVDMSLQIPPSANMAPTMPTGRPKFGSEWNLKAPPSQKTQRKLARELSGSLPFLDPKDGKAKGPLQLGSRVKLQKR